MTTTGFSLHCAIVLQINITLKLIFLTFLLLLFVLKGYIIISTRMPQFSPFSFFAFSMFIFYEYFDRKFIAKANKLLFTNGGVIAYKETWNGDSIVQPSH